MKASPALIIGLGGTGQWVLTYLKKNFLESFGELPPQVKLLAFDTTSEETELGKGELAEEAARVGQVHLDSSEFVYLGGNIKRICEEARAGQHPHISSWLQADAYLGGKGNQIGLSDDDFNLARGAGTRRPFGRMAIFYDLTLTHQSKVRGKIHDALQSVVSTMNKPQPVEICVVCSLAGGTGSGMFIDIAHLVRLIAQEQVHSEIAVRGFLVLHNAFQAVLNVEHVMPNTYAAMRELNRFMTLFGEDYPIDYTDDPHRRNLRTVYSSKLFDSCFLLDAERTQKSLRGEAPKYGVYPSVADCITMLLDPNAGDTLQQHYKNVNDRVASIQREKGVAFYSSLGTYSYIFPANDVQRSCILRFALEFLQAHLASLADSNEEYERADSAQRNLSDKDIAADVLGFLQQGSSQSGVRNTPFAQGVALRISRNTASPDYVRQIARSGLELIEMLQASGETPEVLELGRQVQRITKVSLADEVKTSEEFKDSSENAARRIPQQVEAFRHRYLNGELQHTFETLASINLRRFRDLLQERVNQIFINGASSDLQGSRLGYAQAFLAQVVKAFEDFASLIQDARDYRNKSGEIVHAREAADRTREDMETSKNKNNIVDRLRGLSVRDQRNYIDAEQYLIELEIEEFIYTELSNVSKAHCKIAQALLDDVNQWIAIWTAGDVVQGEPSVLRLIKDAQSRLEQHRQEKALIPVHKYVTDDAYEEQLYKRMSLGKVRHLQNRLRWTCTSLDGRLVLELMLDGKRVSKESRGRSAVDANYDLLLGAVRPYFADIKRETIDTRLAEFYQPEALAEEILSLAAPMIHFRPEDLAAGDIETQTFVSIDNRAVRFWDGVEQALKNRSPNIKDAQTILASDPHRCIVLSTADLVGFTAIQSLAQARRSYDVCSKKSFLHIFPAENTAVRYEERLHDYPFYEKVRHFTSRVTALLEDKDRLTSFVLAYALDIIRIENSPEKRRHKQFMLRVNRERRLDRAFEFALTKPATRPSLFEAIHTFIFRRPLKSQKDAEALIVSADGRYFVELNQVDEAIQLREEVIRRGLEHLVQEFNRFLRIYPDLRPRATTIESEFRYYVNDSIREAMTLGPDELTNRAHDWLEENYDLIPRRYHKEMADRVSQILIDGNHYIDAPEDSTRLQRRFQDFIDGTVSLFKNSKDQDEKDLGVIMHMIIWEYMRRLEQK